MPNPVRTRPPSPPPPPTDATPLTDDDRATVVEGSVLEALGFSAEEAANVGARIVLAKRLRDEVHARGWTQAEAAKALGLTQPRVSYVLNVRAEKFSVDALINLLARVGVRVDALLEDALAQPA